jgi:hypothetical protein
LGEASHLGGIWGIQSFDPGALPIEFRMGDPGVLCDLAEAILQIDKLQASSEKKRSPVTEYRSEALILEDRDPFNDLFFR